MRSWAGLVFLIVIALAVGGCGGTNKAATTAATRSTPAPAASAFTGPRAKSVTYSVKLGPNAKGARGLARARAGHRSGRALISIKGGSDEICWKFSQIRDVVPAPTEAAIQGPLSIGFISSPIEGEGFTASGCLLKPRLLLRVIEATPHKLYVSVENRKYPERGLRGQL